MNQPMQSNGIQKTATLVVIVAIALGAGYYAGRYAGAQAQKQMLKEVFSGAGFIRDLSGEITAIAPGQKFLTVAVRNATCVNFPEAYRDKTVLITADTKMVLREHKDQDAMSKEIKTYQEAVKKAKDASAIVPPSPYSEQKITVGDLKVGDRASFSFNPETIGDAPILNSQFTAIEVAVTR